MWPRQYLSRRFLLPLNKGKPRMTAAQKTRSVFTDPTSSQKLTWTMLPLLWITFYFSIFVFAGEKGVLTFSLPYTVLLALTIGCWLGVSFTNTETKTFICWCFGELQRSHSLYCSVCRRRIEGHDHHCHWLNTCIGSHNYTYFFALTLSSVLMYLCQVIFCLLLILNKDEVDERADQDVFTVRIDAFSDIDGLFYAFVGAEFLAALGIFGAFGSLLAFHILFLFKGYGTSLFMQDYRRRKVAKQRAKARARSQA
eukprot:maker-scaffold_27-snap-gene-3.1-mRNA-1 protein AED:0.02 eAED:0.02 QI:52/1/1/1/0.2/0.33/6/295/253